MAGSSLRRALRRVLGALGLGLALFFGWVLVPRPAPEVPVPDVGPPADVDAWIAERRAASAAAGAWEGAEERLVRHRAGRAGVAMVYVHGFGATRAEGEAVMDLLAREWGANLYYVRLPGHGTNMDDHARAEPAQYFDTVAEALAAAQLLGESVVLVGTSTGGLLATWAAATYPERVDALVVASPLYDYGAAYVKPLAASYGGIPLFKLLFGEVRSARWTADPEGRKGEHYDENWLLDQRYEAVGVLEDVRRVAATDAVFSRVESPVLTLIHYAGPERHDTVISVDRVREAHAAFPGAAQPGSALVEVADGAHVLMSEHVRTDKGAVLAAMRQFLRATVGPPPRETAALQAAEVRAAEDRADRGARGD